MSILPFRVATSRRPVPSLKGAKSKGAPSPDGMVANGERRIAIGPFVIGLVSANALETIATKQTGANNTPRFIGCSCFYDGARTKPRPDTSLASLRAKFNY